MCIFVCAFLHKAFAQCIFAYLSKMLSVSFNLSSSHKEINNSRAKRMNISILTTVSKFTGFVFGVAIVSLASIVGSSSSNAETFVLNGNKALNTNSSFRAIDGHPRMSIWDHSLNDADQNFDRKTGGKGGEHLVNRRTGKCLNAFRRWNGAEVNVYPCRLGDADQNFNVEALSNGEVQIRVANTNFCLDNPNRTNGGQVTLGQCDGNANKRFKINGGGTVTPPPSNGGAYYRNFERFINFVVGQIGIARLDRNDLRGQCVTLIARYVQEVYLTGSDKTKAIALDNGHGTAAAVARQFPQLFEPLTSTGLPKRGAVVSFPEIGYVPNVGCPNNRCGHVGIVMESRTLNGQRQIRIMDSNGDSKNASSKVTEYYSRWINIPNGTTNGYGNNIRWTNPR